MLYPLKFKPLYKERIWGGRELENVLNKKLPKDKIIGESWEISGVEGDVSIVSNGTLKGNNLQELIEIYMGDLVGDKIYERFGYEFPLLIKFIDAQDNLSIQVHPDDKISKQRHDAYGKTEMWYVLDHKPNAQLLLGFKEDIDKQKYVDALDNGEIDKLLFHYTVQKDDAYFIPAGTIHAIGSGMLIAEIQQTSDITYRVFDFNRVDDKGNARELHTELALDVIDYTKGDGYDISQPVCDNIPVRLESCQYFETNTLKITNTLERDYSSVDSFVIYICVYGSVELKTEFGVESLTKGECILIPAIIDSVELSGDATLLETYIPLSEE